MNLTGRPLSDSRRLTTLIVGWLLWLVIAIVLVVSIAQNGLDPINGYGLAPTLLAGIFLANGGSVQPQRWAVLRLATGVVCLFSFVYFIMYGIVLSANEDSYGFGVVAGILLAVVTPFVLAVGRPRPANGEGGR
jgi:hypothetical protein